MECTLQKAFVSCFELSEESVLLFKESVFEKIREFCLHLKVDLFFVVECFFYEWGFLRENSDFNEMEFFSCNLLIFRLTLFTTNFFNYK